MLLLFAKHLLLTGLPFAAAVLFAARQGVRQVPVLLAIGLAVSGLLGLLGFWTFYGSRGLGETYAFFVLLGSLLLAGWSLYRWELDRDLLWRLAVPLGLWALGSAFVLFLGFVHGGATDPMVTAMSRFSHTLPGDNYLPLHFTEWFAVHGHNGTPPDYAGWLSSDRPPLQVGYALSQRPFGWRADQLDYQVMGVLLQQLWIVGLWALLLAARVRPLTRGLAMVAVLLSDLAIVNGFYVWPKLLPAALLVALAALVLTPLWEELRGKLWAAALVAALAALAYLGHGSSVFGIVPLAIVAAWRGMPSWRWLGVAAAVGLVLVGSWSAYQKYGDPPGDRLTKWTLGGFTEIDDRGVLETIVDGYEEAGVGGTIENKWQNFATMSGGEPMVDGLRASIETGEPGQVARSLRAIQFFYIVPGLGLLLLGPVLMAFAWARRRGSPEPAEWRLALSCFAVFAFGAVIWGLLLFGNAEDRTIKHVSSYLLPLLGIVGAVVGMRAVYPRFATWYVGIASLLSLALYAPSLDPPAGSVFSPQAALLAALALGGFAFLALRPRPEAADADGESGDAPSSRTTRSAAAPV